MIQFEHLGNKCYWKISRGNMSSDKFLDLGGEVFLRNEGKNVATCLLSVPVFPTLFFRIKRVYKRWKDMLKMCHVSASILSCLSLSQAQKTVILYFLTYKGQGRTLLVVWLHTSCPRVERRGKRHVFLFLAGTVRIWHSSTYRLESTLNYGMERVWCVASLRGSNNVALGYDEGSIIVKVQLMI